MQEQAGTLGVDAHESRGEAAQGTNVMAQLPGCTWHQIYSEAQKLNEINLMLEEEDEEPGAGARSCRILKDNTSETRGVLFPTSSNKPVGQAFKEIRKMIWSLLKNDEVSTIGIYGMGGTGKTTILQHIHNKLLRRPDICDHVWWVTVSQDFSINRLQNLIAKRLHLDLSSEDDDQHRAAKLSEELRKKQKWTIILDDLWDNFELHDVGIHSLLKGCKLILTTRSQTVCDQIDCQHKIEVKPLFEGDSWTLFKENLGRHITLSDEVEEIAKAVARECAGLPLGIITVARSLRGVKNLNEWRNTLKELGESGYRDMNEKVFKVLRVSYDRLDDALKHCLLYCALFPEDHMIERGELIGYLINEGIIKGMRRRQEAFDKGHTMLNRLEYFSLLENAGNEDDGSKCVMMHDLIRDMAIQILQENSQVIVKAGAQLEELPDAEEWTENLTRVSLMKNKIIKIPSSHSPMCPNLSTLLLCRNYRLESIPDSFFKHLHGLKILDLSRTGIEKLPESVSDLVSLTALLLIDCEWLGYVPSLEKLRALKTLDLYGTSLVKMPQGMECLSYLRYFRIDGCGEEEFPSGILPKLSHLQVLALGERCTVEGMEVGCLGKLETLECHFKGFSDFVEYLTSRDEIHSLSTYKILVGTVNKDIWIGNDDLPSKAVMLGNCNINPDRDFEVKFLNDIQGLYCDSMDARSLCDVLSLESATELEIIYICRCYSMESLVSSSWFGSATPPLPSHNGMFSRLKIFCCVGCNSMEKLFPLELLSYLVNLEVIGEQQMRKAALQSIMELTLPKLKSLYLCGLPELKGICSAKLICNFLEVINVVKCEKLKRMAISLPIDACPKEWWETVVEWEPPNAKEVLRPIVRFTEEDGNWSSDEE
ncbi:disease resistance protein [Salix suchowensis]|nr:disease resistance protein [Salix suchowensis]